MEALALSTDMHRALAVELVDKLPTAAIDDVLLALCARMKRVDDDERGHPSQLDRVARLLRVFDGTVHLAPILYDTLAPSRLTSFLDLALDRFAIDAPAEDVAAVAAMAERFLHAVREPAVEARDTSRCRRRVRPAVALARRRRASEDE